MVFIGFLDVIGDVVLTFLSYVFAMYARYHIMRAQPGIDTLSAPYLLIALVYSIFLAAVLSVTRGNRRGKASVLDIFSVSGVGCLVLLTFLFMANIRYFSRWALLLFWLFTDFFLILKDTFFPILFKKKHNRVLLVGDGDLAKKFAYNNLSSKDSKLDIIGFIGNGKDFQLEDSGFAHYGEEGEKVCNLGKYEEFGRVMEKYAIDEAIIVLENIDPLQVRDILNKSKKPVSLISKYSEFIPMHPNVKELVGIDFIRSIELEKSVDEKSKSFLTFAILIINAALILMLILKKFNIAEIQNFHTYESSRIVLFVLEAFFIYWKLSTEKIKTIKSFLITCILCCIQIIIYEIVYGGAMMKIQIVASIVCTVVCFTIDKVLKSFENEFYFWE